MSSNIKVQRICQYCNTEFTARTTTTKYCHHNCSRKAHKAKIRNAKIEASDQQTYQLKTKPMQELKAKEFLTVREVSLLLNCSVRSIYYYIENGTIKGVNLGQRVTRVKRSEIDQLFEKPTLSVHPIDNTPFDISQSYHIAEIQTKYGVSEKALFDIIKRNGITKVKDGKYVYVSKNAIDKLFYRPNQD